MGYSIGWDSANNRWKGYGVPCTCEHPECDKKVDRSMDCLCEGCGLAFCGDHNTFNFCERCLDEDALDDDEEELSAIEGAIPFPLKPEHPEWLDHLRKDPSWAEWRKGNIALLEQWEAAAQQTQGERDA